MTVEEALNAGLVVLKDCFYIQHNESHGNCVGMRPKWKTEIGWHDTLGQAQTSLAANAPKSARIMIRKHVRTPNGRRDWGYISERVYKG